MPIITPACRVVLGLRGNRSPDQNLGKRRSRFTVPGPKSNSPCRMCGCCFSASRKYRLMGRVDGRDAAKKRSGDDPMLCRRTASECQGNGCVRRYDAWSMSRSKAAMVNDESQWLEWFSLPPGNTCRAFCYPIRTGYRRHMTHQN